MIKKRVFTKKENKILKKRFFLDFSSGKESIKSLSLKYNVDRRKLLIWKKELFGKGSLRQKRILQMHISGIPKKLISEFYNINLSQVNNVIRNNKQT